jgi:uncharacterized damage-inducible protein DinB
MPHPLVAQLRFTRSEFKRALAGLSDADACQRFLPMNCISWTVGHLASTEQAIWLTSLQGLTPLPALNEQYRSGQPAGTPPLAQMWEYWQTVAQLADPFLDTLTTARLLETGMTEEDDRPTFRSTGSLLLRVIYHYWYHLGEVMAIRQRLGHTDLPEFVGDLDTQAPYLPLLWEG